MYCYSIKYVVYSCPESVLDGWMAGGKYIFNLQIYLLNFLHFSLCRLMLIVSTGAISSKNYVQNQNHNYARLDSFQIRILFRHLVSSSVLKLTNILENLILKMHQIKI